MLALKVSTPAYRIFPFYSGSLKDLDTLCVGKAYEFSICYALKSLDKLVVISVVEELDVVVSVVKGILHKVLDEFLREVHVVLDVVECHLRLDHPELCKVARSV